MPSIKSSGISSDKMENILLYELGITTVSGNSFGKYGEGYLRFSCASSEKSIKIAIKKLASFLSNL